MQKCHRPFLHNFSSILDQTDLQKSHQLFDTIFHQFGTKQICRNLIGFLAQFFINSGPNRLAEISPTFRHNFSSIRDQTHLQRSHQLLTQFSLNLSGQPILSGHFAVIAVGQLNFLTQFFFNLEPEATVAIFVFAELFDYFEQFRMNIASSVLLHF
jgi:hypothetical protein